MTKPVSSRVAADSAEATASSQAPDENAQLVQVLQGVVAGTHSLLANDDFELGLNLWLGALAKDAGALRATYYDVVDFPPTGGRTLRALAEWPLNTLSNCCHASFAEPIIIDPRGAQAQIDRSLAGQSIALHTDEVDEPMRSFLLVQGNATVIMVPMLQEGRVVGGVSFDFAERTELSPRHEAILRTAADTLMVILSRNQAQKAALAERAAREQAERARAELAEAARLDAERRNELLEAVVATSDILLRAPTIAEAADAVLARLGTALRTDSFGIGRWLPPDEGSIEGYMEFFAEWAAPGLPRQIDDPTLRVFDLTHYLDIWQPVSRGEYVGILTREFDSERARREQDLTGSKSQMLYPIMVDGRIWGVLAADDKSEPRVWPPEEIASLQLVSAAIGSVVKRERLTEARIAAELERESARREQELAVLEERNRIARDIHDTLAQGFTGVSIQLQAARGALEGRRAKPARALTHIASATELACASLVQARESVYALRPSALTRSDLSEALQALVVPFQAANAPRVSVQVRGVARALAPDIEATVLRIAQESLVNVIKHAQASLCTLTLVYAADAVSLAVRDNGRGFDTASPAAGLGLAGMRERAARLGAQLLIASARGAGTEIVFSVSA